MTRRRMVVIVVLGIIVLLQVTSAGRKLYSTASSFKSGLSSAVPGDTLELADGSYDIGGNSLTKSGTSEQRIVIKALNRGKAELKGSSSFTGKGISYVTIEGFLFTGSSSTVIKTESCSFMRFTRNTFRLTESTSGKWVLIGGTYNIAAANSQYNRIDHNLFENKKQLGNYVTIDGSPAGLGTPDASKYDRIDHNHFRTIGPRAVNEMETIRIGQSEICRSNSYTIVEYNLFEECDGDPEIVSVKTRKTIVRYNTFRRSQGTVCLRSSDSSIVEGNYFLGGKKSGTGGIRAYGSGHTIVNNYFSGLTGDTWDAALTVTNGDAELTGSNTAHWRPTNIVAAFNTFMDNANNIQFGFTNNGSYSKPPANITFANNLVVGSQGQMIKVLTQPSGMIYSGNIIFPTNGASVGISAGQDQVLVTDPQLTLDDSVWRPSAGSPVIDAAAGTYAQVLLDIDGQQRDAFKDVGADEFKQSQRVNRPLTASDVGPGGPDSILTSVVRTGWDENLPLQFTLEQNYPNPFNPSTTIVYSIGRTGMAFVNGSSIDVQLTVHDVLGQTVAVLENGQKYPGVYRVRFDAAAFASGLYFYRLKTGNISSTRKMIIMK